MRSRSRLVSIPLRSWQRFPRPRATASPSTPRIPMQLSPLRSRRLGSSSTAARAAIARRMSQTPLPRSRRQSTASRCALSMRRSSSTRPRTARTSRWPTSRVRPTTRQQRRQRSRRRRADALAQRLGHGTGMPQYLSVDLGRDYDLTDVTFLPRQDGGTNGDIFEAEILSPTLPTVMRWAPPRRWVRSPSTTTAACSPTVATGSR